MSLRSSNTHRSRHMHTYIMNQMHTCCASQGHAETTFNLYTSVVWLDAVQDIFPLKPRLFCWIQTFFCPHQLPANRLSTTTLDRDHLPVYVSNNALTSTTLARSCTRVLQEKSNFARCPYNPMMKTKSRVIKW